MRRLLLFLAAALLAASASAPAAAAPGPTTSIQVCNHSASVDSINAYLMGSAPGSWNIAPSQCRTIPDYYGGQYNLARVDVDIGGSGGDVDSWHKQKGNLGWGPCYNNEDESSDPYSDTNGTVTFYASFSDTNCHN